MVDQTELFMVHIDKTEVFHWSMSTSGKPQLFMVDVDQTELFMADIYQTEIFHVDQ